MALFNRNAAQYGSVSWQSSTDLDSVLLEDQTAHREVTLFDRLRDRPERGLRTYPVSGGRRVAAGEPARQSPRARPR